MCFFIGRGMDYATSMEASLKLKEISYVHSEAYAAGELKHGTISLVEDGTLVVGIVTQERLYSKIISNLVEVKTWGAFILAVTFEDNKEISKTADFIFNIPKQTVISQASWQLCLHSFLILCGSS